MKQAKANGSEQFAHIPINLIDSLKNWNPRTRFEKDQLEQLAGDIAANGVVEPVILRKVAGRRFQIIAGERRVRAAKKAGLIVVPSIVREMDDEKAFQQTVSENMNRVDLHPVEEARAFAKIRDLYHAPPKEIARRTGKTVPYVVNRLQLVTLDRAVADAAMEMGDKLPLGHLQLVAEIGGGDVQMELFNKITKPPYRDGGILGYDQARRELESYQRPLSSAQFKTTDAELTKAPACTECPQNTTNLPREVFSREDICTNLTCFKAKQHATLVQIVAKGTYKEVKGTKEMFPYSHSPNDAHNGWKDVDSRHYDYRDSSNRKDWTYRQWFEQFDSAHAPQFYVTISPHSGRILYVVKEDEANASLTTIKRKLTGKKNASGNGSRRTTSAPNYESKARSATLVKLAARVRETFTKNDTLPLVVNELLPIRQGLELMVRGQLVAPNIDIEDGLCEMAAAWGITLTESQQKQAGYTQETILTEKLVKAAGTMSVAELLALGAELATLLAGPYKQHGKDAFDAWTVAAKYDFDFDGEVKVAVETMKQAAKAAKVTKPKTRAAAG